jgi:NAD(P)-dependent dehydrogenase (short-subunit alcohol dehydrogenase family)
MQMKGIANKVVIVTGGATLMGRAVCAAFAQHGARAVVIADINEAGGLQAQQQGGAPTEFIATDLSQDESIHRCVAQVVQRHGGVDFLVNLAASYVDQGADSTRAQWLESFNVNVAGSAMMLAAVRPHMKQLGGGAVVNLGSISAKVAQTGRWLYPITKAAILQFTRNAAMDLAAEGIRVNSVSPGWTWSDPISQFSGGDRAHADQVGANFHFLGRIGDPAEVADAVLFLCSDHAKFISGTDLAVDGGYSAMGPEQAKPAIPLLMKEAAA